MCVIVGYNKERMILETGKREVVEIAPMERNIALEEARLRKGWSLEAASEKVGVHRNTLGGWERGKHKPPPGAILDLCQFYEATPEELGLDKFLYSKARQNLPSPELAAKQPTGNDETLLERGDLAVLLATLVLRYDRRSTSYKDLQNMIYQTIKDYDDMAQQEQPDLKNPGRRGALRFLALLPIDYYGLTLLGSKYPTPAEEFLPHIAAGLTACWPLTKGTDLAFVQRVAKTYLTTLEKLVHQSTSRQQATFSLTAEAHLLAGLMGMHLDGLGNARYHFMEAVKYSSTTKDDNLKVCALNMLAGTFVYEKRYQEALDTCRKGFPYLKNAASLMRSDYYASSAEYQATIGQEQDALHSLGKAHEAFTNQSEWNPPYAYILHDQFILTMKDGLAHLHLRKYDKAQDSFGQISKLQSGVHIPNSIRIQLEVLNNQALTEVRRKDRDMQRCLAYWQLGMKGAIDLHSERRYSEAYQIYEMMTTAWPDEKPVEDLGEQIRYWIKERDAREKLF